MLRESAVSPFHGPQVRRQGQGVEYRDPGSGYSGPSPAPDLREGDVLDMAASAPAGRPCPDPYRPALWLLALAGPTPAELCGLRVEMSTSSATRSRSAERLCPCTPSRATGLGQVRRTPEDDAGRHRSRFPLGLCEDLAADAGGGGRPRSATPALPDRATATRSTATTSGTRSCSPHFMRPACPITTRTYDLRHSHASLLIDLGANPLAIAQRMGHGDASVTLARLRATCSKAPNRNYRAAGRAPGSYGQRAENRRCRRTRKLA